MLVAVSGGSDSVALLHLLVALQEQIAISGIGVAHVNHGLRGRESDNEESFVAQLAREAGCRFFRKKLEGKSLHDPGVEEWARTERYRFFAEIKEKHGYHYIATGHTAEDQAETLFMNVQRGCGLTGLCGILPVRDDGIIRPLLSLRKEALQAWLTGQGYHWYEDPSNADIHYTRNWVRYKIIPGLARSDPHIIEKSVMLTGYFQKQKQFLKPLVNKWVTDHVIEERQERFVLRKSEGKPAYILAGEGVSRLFRKHGIAFDKNHISTFLKEMKRTSGCFLLKDGWRYYPGKDSVEVISGKDETTVEKKQVDSYEIQVPGTTVCENADYCFSAVVQGREECDCRYDRSNWTVYLDADKTGQKLLFRPVKRDDIFQPLGFDQPVTCIRFLKNQKLGSFYRPTTGVVVNNAEILVWIPGVAIGNAYRITDDTRTILRISCRRIP